MKYCIKYRRDLKCKDEADELSIIYDRADTTLFRFLKKYKDKRINIFIEDPADFIDHNDIKRFESFEQEIDTINYAFVLPDCRTLNSKNLYKMIKNRLSKALVYFNTRVNNWDVLMGLVSNYEISDIYITEDLGFELPFVKSFLEPYGIRIRCFANVCQSQWEGTQPFKTFFIRPEDVDTYEPYIDVLEFFYVRIDQQNVFLRIYSQEKKWSGNLAEIIFSFYEEDVDNRCILPEFAEKRLSCSRKCYRGEKCLFCHRALGLAKAMTKAQIHFTHNESLEE